MFHESAKQDEAIDLRRALGVLSSSQDRVKALLGLGFAPDEIATAVGVSGQAVRDWADGKVVPSTRNQDRLDEFRAITLLLYEEIDRVAVRAFFCSRPAPGEKPPLDYVYSDPQAVGAAAMAQIAYQEELQDGERNAGSADDLSPDVQGLLADAHHDSPGPNLPEPAVPDKQGTVALTDDAHTELVYERRMRLALPPNRAC